MFTFVSFVLNAQHKEKVKTERIIDEEKDINKKLNIKILPAVYWQTVGMFLEIPTKSKFSLQFNLLGKYGRTDNASTNSKINDADYLNNGFRAELNLNYYLDQSPTGFFFHSFLGYSSLIYNDGTTRPLSLFIRNTKLESLKSANQLKTPIPICAGIGCGYQFMVIPQHLIFNIVAAIQVSPTSQGLWPGIFISPSFGYVF